jgi:hypothetical protein
MKNIKLNIIKNKIIGKLPEEFFGHFIEYMHDCIEPGLWAQILKTRSFEDMGKTETVSFEPWKCFGENTLGELDSSIIYAPSYSIHIVNNGNEYGGIKQENLKLHNEELYNGHIWAYSKDNVILYIKVKCDREIVFNDKLIPGEWKKVNFSFYNAMSDSNAEIFFYIDGQKEVWLDQASLVPDSAVVGTWKSVIKKVKGLKPGTMRFPGGCVADCYFWEDGIGLPDKRPCKENRHWGGMESNSFGTDEYIKFCREIEAEPLICVNFGSSTPYDAANWVEYCNGDTSTEYGKKRVINGNIDPYNVKYWEIGNEVFADWETGNCSASDYIKKYILFAKEMKNRDKKIFLFACGGDAGKPEQSWNETVLKEGKGYIDALSLHFYAPLIEDQSFDDEQIYYATVSASEKFDKVIKATCGTMKKVGYKVPIAVTEWNCNYGEKNTSEREQSLEAVIANAGIINTFLRNINDLNICNVSDLINGWSGGIIRSKDGVSYETGTYRLIKLFVDSNIDYIVESSHNGEIFEIEKTGNIEKISNIPYLDVVCCLDKSGKYIIFVINRNISDNYTLVFDEEIESYDYIWAEDIHIKNTWECKNNIGCVGMCGNGKKLVLLPHSVYRIKLK